MCRQPPCSSGDGVDASTVWLISAVQTQTGPVLGLGNTCCPLHLGPQGALALPREVKSGDTSPEVAEASHSAPGLRAGDQVATPSHPALAWPSGQRTPEWRAEGRLGLPARTSGLEAEFLIPSPVLCPSAFALPGQVPIQPSAPRLLAARAQSTVVLYLEAPTRGR